MTGPQTQLLIDGALVAGGAGAFPTINPATEEPLGKAADGDAADLDRAVAAARTAFDSSDWGRDTALRVHCLRQLRDALNDEIETLREITIAEVGAPRSLTYRGQLQTPVDDLAFPAATAESYPWRVDLGVAAPMGITTARTVVREPFGVVGAITPWNFPHQVTFAKIGPALAAGNTIVLKPAPDTPWCAAEVGRIIAEKTDFPPGVVNIVTASDHRIGAQLAEDPRVDVVSFTGSTATGRSVMTAAAQAVDRSASSRTTNADLPPSSRKTFLMVCAAAASTVAMHAGQGCALTTRLLVPRQRYGEALDAVAAAMSRVAVGDPNDPKTLCGPLISAKQRDRVQSYLDLAIAEGGTFHCGGGRPAGLDWGFYIEPTVIGGLTNQARVAREEIFGPVLVVLAHDGDADALRIANDSPYGLSATVFGSVERAARIASRLRAGTINVNGGMWYSADVPFGGYKQSGVGREMGLAGFEEYLETKAVATAVPGAQH
ncbi:aldehyde dehydrogenase [Mycolicibacter heraklionensis]|uniref:Aldehyde dehydrogenase n=1 Tax=Mycolicibacter heraklionensis TaxID=512402 RepID=A0AA91ETP2_9MYCO|nr:aldehyde dehydrogenase [Mycolicibacter heraklionensis]OBK84053.1 aldehyde dehydrogenase [Mycolicibacter heraklionensis]